MTREPAAAPDLSGQWVFDPVASDDALKLIAHATPKPAAPPPNGGADPCALVAPSGGSQNGGRRGNSALQGGPVCNDRASVTDDGPRLRPSDRAQFVRMVVVPAELIQIMQSPEHLVLVQADRRREFEPGLAEAVSVTDRYGSRQVQAGWHGREFVIRSADRNRVVVEETLRAGAAPATLELDVTLKAWNYDKIRARAVYRRAEGARPVPAADGPPVGGSH